MGRGSAGFWGVAVIRLVVCLPQTETVRCEYACCLGRMMLYLGFENQGIADCRILRCSSSILPAVRQHLAERAIDEAKATHLLWIDSDHTFPHDTAHRLLSHKRPYVGINATTRVMPIRPTAIKKQGQPLETTKHSKGLERVWRMGFGIVLVEARVFKAMPKPWFNVEYIEKDGKPRFVGEDIYFCEKAKAYGFAPMVDHDLTKETAHIGSVAFDTAFLEDQ